MKRKKLEPQLCFDRTVMFCVKHYLYNFNSGNIDSFAPKLNSMKVLYQP